MKKLHEIITELNELHSQKDTIAKAFDRQITNINAEISELKKLKALALSSHAIDLIQIAEEIINVSGNPYGITSDQGTIAASAINDIANGCARLKTAYFGNKRYDGYYQREDHEYGYGPKHGYIVDEISLRETYRNKELTSEQKDACIYYIATYPAIAATIKTLH